MSFKIGVLKHFANFMGKHLSWSLFLKLLAWRVVKRFSQNIKAMAKIKENVSKNLMESIGKANIKSVI